MSLFIFLFLKYRAQNPDPIKLSSFYVLTMVVSYHYMICRLLTICDLMIQQKKISFRQKKIF